MLSDERAELTRLAGEYAAAMECRTQAVVDECEHALVAYVDSLLAQARADALEEAAKVADDWASGSHTASGIAATIRARKDGQ